MADAVMLIKQMGDRCEYLYTDKPWMSMALSMDDVKGYPTREQAIEAFYAEKKAKRDKEYSERMDDIWREDM